MPAKIPGALIMQKNQKTSENVLTAEAHICLISFVCIVGIILGAL